ncbi:MAG TPA: hypothetical protein VKA02_09470, partial [Candidatus Acidoferrum sp.]|nr:hypothetical protein [Candidatus Acidoferrum sp.]
RICPWRNVFVALIGNILCNVLYIYTVLAPRCQLHSPGLLRSPAHLVSPSGQRQLDYDGVLHEVALPQAALLRLRGALPE